MSNTTRFSRFHLIEMKRFFPERHFGFGIVVGDGPLLGREIFVRAAGRRYKGRRDDDSIALFRERERSVVPVDDEQRIGNGSRIVAKVEDSGGPRLEAIAWCFAGEWHSGTEERPQHAILRATVVSFKPGGEWGFMSNEHYPKDIFFGTDRRSRPVYLPESSQLDLSRKGGELLPEREPVKNDEVFVIVNDNSRRGPKAIRWAFTDDLPEKPARAD